jgi:hypothetical protein
MERKTAPRRKSAKSVGVPDRLNVRANAENANAAHAYIGRFIEHIWDKSEKDVAIQRSEPKIAIAHYGARLDGALGGADRADELHGMRIDVPPDPHHRVRQWHLGLDIFSLVALNAMQGAAKSATGMIRFPDDLAGGFDQLCMSRGRYVDRHEPKHQ